MKVKICVMIDKFGGWACDGWAKRMEDGSLNIPTYEEVESNLRDKLWDKQVINRYWVVADIPDPEIYFVEGKVEPKQSVLWERRNEETNV